MNPKLLLCLFVMTSLNIYSQTMDFKGKKYNATETWNFICENYALTGITAIQIAKTENGGLLKIAVETTNTNHLISGTTYVFLTDNTVLTCTDKRTRELKDGQISSYYMFSSAEMNKLKSTEIQSIHFNIEGNTSVFTSQVGNFTAVNQKHYFSTVFNKNKKSYDTVEAITSLYQ